MASSASPQLSCSTVDLANESYIQCQFVLDKQSVSSKQRQDESSQLPSMRLDSSCVKDQEGLSYCVQTDLRLDAVDTTTTSNSPRLSCSMIDLANKSYIQCQFFFR